MCAELEKKWNKVTSDLPHLLANRVYIACLAEEFNRPDRQKVEANLKKYLSKRNEWSEDLDVDPYDLVQSYYNFITKSQQKYEV